MRLFVSIYASGPGNANGGLHGALYRGTACTLHTRQPYESFLIDSNRLRLSALITRFALCTLQETAPTLMAKDVQGRTSPVRLSEQITWANSNTLHSRLGAWCATPTDLATLEPREPRCGSVHLAHVFCVAADPPWLVTRHRRLVAIHHHRAYLTMVVDVPGVWISPPCFVVAHLLGHCVRD